MNAYVIAALIALFGALIASLVAYTGLLISKETKISEFRQAWIDALRIDVAKMIGLLESFSDFNQMTAVEARKLSIGIATIDARIQMRLNPAEQECQAVEDALAQLHGVAGMFLHPGLRSETSQQWADATRDLLLTLTIAKQTLLGTSQTLFKKEWEKVKKGEPVYQESQLYAKYLWRGLIGSIAVMLFIAFLDWCYALLVPAVISALSR